MCPWLYFSLYRKDCTNFRIMSPRKQHDAKQCWTRPPLLSLSEGRAYKPEITPWTAIVCKHVILQKLNSLSWATMFWREAKCTHSWMCVHVQYFKYSGQMQSYKKMCWDLRFSFVASCQHLNKASVRWLGTKLILLQNLSRIVVVNKFTFAKVGEKRNKKNKTACKKCTIPFSCLLICE